MSGRAKSRRKASHKARRLLKKLSKKKSKQSLKLVGLYPASLYSVYDGKAFVPRMLPIRPGQKTTLARSDPFFNLIQRPTLLSVRESYASVGLINFPQMIYKVTKQTLPKVLCSSPYLDSETCEFIQINEQKVLVNTLLSIGEYVLRNDIQSPVIGSNTLQFDRFGEQRECWTFTLSESLTPGGHAVGCVQVPLTNTIFLCNTYKQAPQLSYQIRNALLSYFGIQIFRIHIFPTDFNDSDTEYNLQEICHIETRGVCQYMSVILPYLLAKERVFHVDASPTRSSSYENQGILERAQSVQKKQNHPSISTFNDVKRELGLL